MRIILLIISFLSSVVGTICGIGGGIIIKPMLDVFNIMPVVSISFLSSCTVLSMSVCTLISNVAAKNIQVDFRVTSYLAAGAAVGGIIGKRIFELTCGIFENTDKIGGYQAICILALTMGTLLYTIFQNHIKEKRIHSKLASIMIGLTLGIASSFLGIGGGPFNLAVLYYFYSMKTKEAAQNSLFIILISQIASLVTTLVMRAVPDVNIIALLLMAGGGITGGLVGTRLNKRLSNSNVHALFIALMIIIIGVNCANIYRFL